LRCDRARPSECAASRPARVRGGARTRTARLRTAVAAPARRTHRARGRPVRTRRACGARGARVRAVGHLRTTSPSVANAPCPHRREMSVDAAYAEVQRVTRKRARNFAYGIMVLPREKRRGIADIYAFARRVDDIADGELPEADKRAALVELQVALQQTVARDDAMLVALADARRRFPIPDTALHALVDGGLQDLEQTRYATFDELHGYCRKVAGAVGLACVAVYGSEDAQRAEKLGVALQLINIMRDVREDWELGRVYLPQDELRSFGVDEDDIAHGRCTPAWQALMAYHAARARAHLEDGLTLLSYRERPSARAIRRRRRTTASTSHSAAALRT